MSEINKKIIGIDLGTTNTCVSVLEGGEAIVIHNQEGGRTTPSMVSWSQEGDVIVGAASKRQMVTNPERTVFGVKRLIGRPFRSDSIQDIIETLPYKVVKASNGDAWVEINEKPMSPEEVASHILRKMKSIAEDYLGETVEEAVVTVPAYFDDVQRKATKDAGTIAGLKINAILNEPTAAALAYGANHGQDQKLAVFDLGGGTFDISILCIEDGVFEVKSTHGDTELGGDDFDRQLIDLLCREFEEKNQICLRDDSVALQRLKEAVERAKIELSSSMSTEINLPFLAATSSGPIHLERSLSRGELEGICAPLVGKLAAPCVRALRDAGLEASDLDQILLVGGMTRMPAVQKEVLSIFGKESSKGVNPDEIVALGAATQSGIVSGELEEIVLLDVTPHNIGIRVAGDKMSVMIPANDSIPTRSKKVFTTTEDGQSFVKLQVYQGASEKASKNRHLGCFTLGDLPSGAKGTIHVEVSFTMNADGMLQVSAVEKVSGKESTVSIEASGGLTAEQLDLFAG